MNNMILALPEMFLAVAGLLLLLLSAWRSAKGAEIVTGLTLFAFVTTGSLLWLGPVDKQTALGGMVTLDGFRWFVKLLILIVSGYAIAFSPHYVAGSRFSRPEYPVLALFATLGMLLMVSANDFIALYVGLELQNLALYVLVSFKREETRGTEAGLKYFMLGALSSVILLFGLSFLYGIVGSTNFDAITAYLAGNAHNLGILAGIAFVMAGLAFKISAVPFHMWTPDVYEGAPTPVTAFLAAAPKIAAMALLTCLIAGPLAGASKAAQPLLIFFAIASMIVGSVGGLIQTNIKRLMAYSAIANIGTILVGLIVFNAQDKALSTAGLQGVLLYLVVYAVAVLGVFAVLLRLRQYERPVSDMASLAGLSKGQPMTAAAMAACLFSLAGVPPLAGFFGKYFVLISAVQAQSAWLALLGVLTSVVAAWYYLRIIKIMYFDTQKGLPLTLVSGKIPALLAYAPAVFLILFILMPAPFIDGVRLAVESLVVP